MAKTSSDQRSCGCKVGRMITAYDLVGSNQRMVDWWTDDDDNRSLRDLETHFNQQLLREEMHRQEMRPLDGEVSNVYRLLTADDVSQGMRTQARKRLEREGVDVDALTDDFVSYQSIYRHLNECLSTEYATDDPSADSRRETGKERIFALENRTETVTRDTLAQLARQDALALEEFDVMVDVSVTCLHCHRRHTIDEIVDNEGCECQQ